jgi:DNA-binding NarL/FixJ family response regulator
MWDGASGARPIRVLIADDHDVARRRLRAQLSEALDVEVVGEADDGALALQLARWLQPDVALLDERLPKIGGLELARVFAAQLPEVRVVILTDGASAVAELPADVPAGWSAGP